MSHRVENKVDITVNMIKNEVTDAPADATVVAGASVVSSAA